MPEELSLGVMLFGFGLTYLTVHNRKVVGFPLGAVLICLFEDLRVKNFSFDRFFQGR